MERAALQTERRPTIICPTCLTELPAIQDVCCKCGMRVPNWVFDRLREEPREA